MFTRTTNTEVSCDADNCELCAPVVVLHMESRPTTTGSPVTETVTVIVTDVVTETDELSSTVFVTETDQYNSTVLVTEPVTETDSDNSTYIVTEPVTDVDSDNSTYIVTVTAVDEDNSTIVITETPEPVCEDVSMTLRVISLLNLETVPEARITVTLNSEHVLADSVSLDNSGVLSLSNVENGEYTATVSAPGYFEN